MENKICGSCKVEKPVGEFYYKKKEKRYNSWCKECVYTSQKNRWVARKKKVVEIMGGKCCKCGYDKNYACFDLHHLEPSEKDYDWKKLRLKKWIDILEEIKKCILVCRNCHGELHNPHATMDGSPIENDNNQLNLGMLQPTGTCPICEIATYGTKYCSVECSRKGSRKVERPSKNELKLLLETESYSALGRKYNVSDNAVRKWAKTYGLFLF